MGEADYYLLIGGQEEGPWTLGHVRAFWQAGAVLLETLYARPESSEWEPLSTLLDVGSAATSPLPSEWPSTAVAPPQEDSNAEDQRRVIETVVDVLLPLEGSADGSAVEASMDEPVEPAEIVLPKARLWLRDTLRGLGFHPTKEAAEARRFKQWLDFFSSEAQEAMFGSEALKHYRRENWTWQDLIAGLGSSPVPPTESARGNAEAMTPENTLWIMEIVWQIEQANEALPCDTNSTAAESKLGNAGSKPQVNKRHWMSPITFAREDAILAEMSVDELKAMEEWLRGRPLSQDEAQGWEEVVRRHKRKPAAASQQRMEPKRPMEVHLAKFRLWLLGTLAEHRFKPAREKLAVDAYNFSDRLSELSEIEQDVIFGTERMECYRSGKLTSVDLIHELERWATRIRAGDSNALLEFAFELYDDEERIAPQNAPRAIAIIEHAIKEASPEDSALLSEANSMLAGIYAQLGQMDKVAVRQQHRIAGATSRGSASEIMAVARELRNRSDEITPETATEIIGLAEAALGNVRGFGLLCEAFDLLTEANSELGNTDAVRTCRQRQLEAINAAIEKGIPVESNQRSNAYGRAADICEEIGKTDEASEYRKHQLECGDGFGLLDTALAKLKTCDKTLDKEMGIRLLDFLTKAVERIPAEFPDRHAVAYRATGEILEVLGDKEKAVEYYEYALQKNPKVGVKKRLDALRKRLPPGV